MIDILMLNFYNFSKTRTSLTLHVNSIVYNGGGVYFMSQTVVKCLILQSFILHNTLYTIHYFLIHIDVHLLSGSKFQHRGILHADIKQTKMYIFRLRELDTLWTSFLGYMYLL